MSNSFNVYIEEGLRALELLKKYRDVAREVKEKLEYMGLKVKVYVFGSTVKGRYTASSDIDILVIVEDDISREKRIELKAEIYKEFDAPLEVHIVTREEYERWYKRFIELYEEV